MTTATAEALEADSSPAPEEHFFTAFLRGRALLQDGQLDEARTLLHASLARNDFAWPHYELAALELRAGRLDAAAHHATLFLDLADRDSLRDELNAIHHGTILDIAHRCFTGAIASAAGLYQRARRLGFGDYLATLRLAEAELNADGAQQARALLDELAARYGLDPWGSLALARLHGQEGNLPAGLAAVETVLAGHETDPFLLVQCGHRLIDLGGIERAASVAASLHANVDAALVAGLRFRVALHREDVASARSLLDGYGEALENWILVESVFRLTQTADRILRPELSGAVAQAFDLAASVAALLERRPTGQLGPTLALLQFYVRVRQWDRAQHLLDSLHDQPLAQHREILLRRFDLACLTGRLDDADALLTQQLQPGGLNNWEAHAAIRYLAECRRWPEAFDILRRMAQRGDALVGAEASLLRIVRRVSGHATLLNDIESARAGLPATKSGRWTALADMVRDDMDLTAHAAGQIARPLSDVNRTLSPLTVSAAAIPNATVAFLCVNQAYFLSSLTFFASFAHHNCLPAGALDWVVFLDDDVPAAWHDMLLRLTRTCGLAVRLVAERSFAPCGDHRVSYGMFTGGNALSRAAYFRLYAARFLLAERRWQRACYFDSDIVCAGDLSSFISLPFGRASLLCCPEEPSPEIRDVAARHRLAPDTYFNSGVLQFDFTCADMQTCLDAAIALAEYAPERLVFHDQCALNIAFAGRTKSMAADYNFFLRPHREDNGDASRAVLLHFLDRPKPWDVGYRARIRPLWEHHAGVVRMLLGPDAYAAVVAAANDHRIAAAPAASPKTPIAGPQLADVATLRAEPPSRRASPRTPRRAPASREPIMAIA